MDALNKFFTYHLRSGSLFRRYVNEITAAARYSPSELAEYRNEKLRKIISIAYEEVPYYAALFRERGLVPSDITRVEDLEKLPIIDKKTVRENFRLFKNRRLTRFAIKKGYTSGTSGTPGIFLRDYASINFENAAIEYQLSLAGVPADGRRVWLRGDSIYPKDRATPPFWKLNRVENKLVMSSYHLAERNLPYYLDAINDFRPALLQAYPSTAYALACYLEKTDQYLSVPVVQTSSEVLYDEWRKLIETRLRARVFDYYGMAERVCFGYECSAHRDLHLCTGYGVSEVVTQGDTPEGVDGVLVGTSLNNFIMPLIRYRADDLVARRSEPCPCGCAEPMIRPVTTRLDDVIVTPEGKTILPILFVFCFNKASHIDGSQLLQRSDGSLLVRLVRGAGFRAEDGAFVRSKIGELMGPNAAIEIEYVVDLPRGGNSKFKWITSQHRAAR